MRENVPAREYLCLQLVTGRFSQEPLFSPVFNVNNPFMQLYKVLISQGEKEKNNIVGSKIIQNRNIKHFHYLYSIFGYGNNRFTFICSNYIVDNIDVVHNCMGITGKSIVVATTVPREYHFGSHMGDFSKINVADVRVT